MSTSQPVWCNRLPAKRPPSDPPMIKARRLFEPFTCVIRAGSLWGVGLVRSLVVSRRNARTDDRL
jgi:hypothetical protein